MSTGLGCNPGEKESHWEDIRSLWSVNKNVRTWNKAGIWSWDITDWLAPRCGSVRAAEQGSSNRVTPGAGWVSLVVGVSAVSLSETCVLFTTASRTHLLCFSSIFKRARNPSPTCLLFLLPITSSPFVSSSLPFPFLFWPWSLCFALLPPHSSWCPSLLPSILQMLVGSRTISIGSWWPTTPPKLGHFLLLSLVLLLIGSYTLLTTHILA